MDEVKTDRQLKGKNNFVSWKREFERVAKTNDTIEYLTGEEVVPPKLWKEDYFVKPVKVETRRSASTRKASTSAPDDADEPDYAQAILMATTNSNP